MFAYSSYLSYILCKKELCLKNLHTRAVISTGMTKKYKVLFLGIKKKIVPGKHCFQPYIVCEIRTCHWDVMYN